MGGQNISLPDSTSARTAAHDTPAACGENVFGIVPFRRHRHARCHAHRRHQRLAHDRRHGPGVQSAGRGHLYPEIFVHLVADVPNGLTVEYMPWSNRLFKETPKIADGKIEVSARPGFGLEFDEKVCAEYAA